MYGKYIVACMLSDQHCVLSSIVLSFSVQVISFFRCKLLKIMYLCKEKCWIYENHFFYYDVALFADCEESVDNKTEH